MIYGNEDNFLEQNFERVEGGWVAYKIFNSLHKAPSDWLIVEQSWITDDNLDTYSFRDCGSGINVAHNIGWIRDYIQSECDFTDELGNDYADVWKVFIPENADIVVPEGTEGKIRVNRLQLLTIVQQLPYQDDSWNDDDDYDEDDYDEDDYDEDAEDNDETIYAG